MERQRRSRSPRTIAHVGLVEAHQHGRPILVVIGDVKQFGIGFEQHVALVHAADKDDDGIVLVAQPREEFLGHIK